MLTMKFIKSRFVHVDIQAVYENIKKAETFAPESLVLKNEKGDELFRVQTGSKTAISKYGMSVAKGDKAFAELMPVGTKLEEVQALYGLGLARANKVLAQVQSALNATQASFQNLIVEEDADAVVNTEEGAE